MFVIQDTATSHFVADKWGFLNIALEKARVFKRKCDASNAINALRNVGDDQPRNYRILKCGIYLIGGA